MQRRKSGSYGSFSSLAIVTSSTTFFMKYASVQNILALLLIIMFLFIIIAFASMRLGKMDGCLPAPYLYVSMTDQQNIMSISRDGCIVTQKVLWAPELHNQALNLRSMYIGQYYNKSVLYVANAASGESNILIFKNCSYWYGGMRPYITKTLSSAQNSLYQDGAKHAYGLAFDKHGNIYASFEKSNTILRATKDSFLPMQLPAYPYIRYRPPPPPPSPPPSSSSSSSSKNSFNAAYPNAAVERGSVTHSGNYYSSASRNGDAVAGGGAGALPSHHNKTLIPSPNTPPNTTIPPPLGTFIQFQDADSAYNLTEGGSGIRSIAWACDCLWIANELDNAVFVVDANGYLLHTISISSPIGLFYFASDRSMLVSSKSKKNGGVFAFDESTFLLTRSFLLMSMHHPSGLTVYEDTLFVADQSINGVLAFKISTGRFLKTILTIDAKKSGQLEHLVLSPC